MKFSLKLLSVILCLILAFSAFAVTAFAAEEEYSQIFLDVPFTVDIAEPHDEANLVFIPEKTAWYKIYTDADVDTRCYVYDEDNYLFAYNDDGNNDDVNFEIIAQFEAGATYYLEIDLYGMETATFDVYLSECILPSDFTISAEKSYEINVGENIEVDVFVTPEEAISNFSVQVVSEEVYPIEIMNCHIGDGYFYLNGVYPGKATIYVTTANELVKTFEVTVLKPELIPLTIGETYTLTENNANFSMFSFKPEINEPTNFTLASTVNDGMSLFLTSPDDSYFEESVSGELINKQIELLPGISYELAVMYGNPGDEIAIAPVMDISSVQIVDKDYFGAYDEEIGLEYSITPFYATYDEIKWSSSDESVAYVNDQGYVTFNSNEGTAEITVTIGEKSDSVTVTAKEFEVIENGFEKSYSLPKGGKIHYKFTPTKSGKYAFYTTGSSDTVVTLYDDLYRVIADNDDNYGDLNCKLKYFYEAGETYYIDVAEVDSCSADFNVYLEEAVGIDSIEILELPYVGTIYPETVNSIDLWGLKLRFNYADGTYVDVLHGDTETVFEYFVYIDSVTEDEVVFAVEADDVVENFSFPISENPVSRIEVDSDFKLYVYENLSGELGNNAEGEFFYYYYAVPDDLKITIYYKTGVTKTVNFYSPAEGSIFEVSDYQFIDPWVKGGTNFVTISYLGITDVIPVEVLQNTVKTVEITKLPDLKRYTYGDSSYGVFYGDGSYDFQPDFSGMEVTVTFEDNSKVTYSFDENINLFIYGYKLAYLSVVADDVGIYSVDFSFFGKPLSFEIEVVEGKIGDCNNDGDVNTSDLAALKLYLASGDYISDFADMNGDSAIDTTDLAALKLLLAGITN